jgi:hypothetical protein
MEAVRSTETEVTPVKVEVSPHRRLVDARVDIIACFKVIEPLVNKMKDGLKQAMKKEGAQTAKGAVAVASLRIAKPTNVIDPLKFWKLCQERKIPMAEVVACISVAKTKAEQLLSKRDLLSISDEGPTPDASLMCEMETGEEIPSAQEAAIRLSAYFSSAKEDQPLKLVGHNQND